MYRPNKVTRSSEKSLDDVYSVHDTYRTQVNIAVFNAAKTYIVRGVRLTARQGELRFSDEGNIDIKPPTYHRPNVYSF